MVIFIISFLISYACNFDKTGDHSDDTGLKMDQEIVESQDEVHLEDSTIVQPKELSDTSDKKNKNIILASAKEVELTSKEPAEVIEPVEEDHSQIVDRSNNSKDVNAESADLNTHEIEIVLDDEIEEGSINQTIKHNSESKEDLVNENLVEPIDHSTFDAMCRKYISAEGLVNYKEWKTNESALNDYLLYLSKNHPTDTWKRDEALAYWINAYNAFTIKLILKNYPLKSIMDLDGGDPWSVKWIHLGEKTYSLNNIEHDIIRPTFDEPRIHFAVNCAAKSCPPLKPKAYTTENLEKLLDEASNYFINNSDYNKITSTSAEVSQIFEWYGDDFGDVRSFINRYRSDNIDKSVSIKYISYDWSLNGI